MDLSFQNDIKWSKKCGSLRKNIWLCNKNDTLNLWRNDAIWITARNMGLQSDQIVVNFMKSTTLMPSYGKNIWAEIYQKDSWWSGEPILIKQMRFSLKKNEVNFSFFRVANEISKLNSSIFKYKWWCHIKNALWGRCFTSTSSHPIFSYWVGQN